MADYEAMKKRLEELERENARLKGQRILKRTDIKAVVGSFKGHPVLTFEGPFKPFTLGLKKSWIVLQKVDEIKAFVEQNRASLSSATDAV